MTTQVHVVLLPFEKTRDTRKKFWSVRETCEGRTGVTLTALNKMKRSDCMVWNGIGELTVTCLMDCIGSS